MEFITGSGTFSLIILPMLIFIARVMDVTFGTIRIIFVSRGKKYLAPLLGFFEIMIWLFAIGQIFINLTSIEYYVAYAGGFATGNFVGIWIEEKLAIGTLVIRIITKKDSTQLIECLKARGYGVTSVDAHGVRGDVKLIYTIIKRKDLQNVEDIIKKFDPKAFYSIEEVRSASEGIFPPTRPIYKKTFLSSFSRRTGK
ncbi:MAG: DUF2179 domain-containing protein [Candidatus Methanoperedens sp.]|nr:DUF2179 domain-containing protein [Candidatus Methanoperedens sp.]